MIPQSSTWPYIPTLARLGLALAIGLLVGIERHRRGGEPDGRRHAVRPGGGHRGDPGVGDERDREPPDRRALRR
jgi:hypothetical protein